MADAGGSKSGHDSYGSYDGVVREASFGPQSQGMLVSSGEAAQKKRADARKVREEQARKEAEEKAKETK
jgi:hypothetical protein